MVSFNIVKLDECNISYSNDVLIIYEKLNIIDEDNMAYSVDLNNSRLKNNELYNNPIVKKEINNKDSFIVFSGHAKDRLIDRNIDKTRVINFILKNTRDIIEKYKFSLNYRKQKNIKDKDVVIILVSKNSNLNVVIECMEEVINGVPKFKFRVVTVIEKHKFKKDDYRNSIILNLLENFMDFDTYEFYNKMTDELFEIN